ncbi:unnamed protein product, partial [Protopolystoma xenopodis]
MQEPCGSSLAGAGIRLLVAISYLLQIASTGGFEYGHCYSVPGSQVTGCPGGIRASRWAGLGLRQTHLPSELDYKQTSQWNGCSSPGANCTGALSLLRRALITMVTVVT